jgi:hypothetical protein
MGFADETYRARKQVVHDLMTRIAGAPVVLHDFHFPEDRAQSARDRCFWLDARWTVTGTDETSLRVPTEHPSTETASLWESTHHPVVGTTLRRARSRSKRIP